MREKRPVNLRTWWSRILRRPGISHWPHRNRQNLRL